MARTTLPILAAAALLVGVLLPTAGGAATVPLPSPEARTTPACSPARRVEDAEAARRLARDLRDLEEAVDDVTGPPRRP